MRQQPRTSLNSPVTGGVECDTIFIVIGGEGGGKKARVGTFCKKILLVLYHLPELLPHSKEPVRTVVSLVYQRDSTPNRLAHYIYAPPEFVVAY